MEYKDYYKILGVERNASDDEIKKAYRKLARKHHPDVSGSPGSDTKFKEISEAYQVLKDPEKRAAYDRLGSGWQAGQDFRPPGDWPFAGGVHFGGGRRGGGSRRAAAGASRFSDFFEALFGGAAGFGGPAGEEFRASSGPFSGRGEDVEARVTIDLEDAYRGATRQISLQAPEISPEGRMTARTRTLNVRIPKGIKQGQKIRLAGQGGAGAGGEPGDLFLEVAFRPHRHFRVKGADVYLDLPVAPWEAALGATVKVPTPSGPVDMKIPADSQQGRTLRLKGRGIPAKTPGDLYVVLQIALPPADTDEARKAYETMREALLFEPRAGLEE